jgi:hypothetical protein
MTTFLEKLHMAVTPVVLISGLALKIESVPNPGIRGEGSKFVLLQ